MSDVLLEVENLVTAFDTEAGRLRAVDGVSFQVRRGHTLGIVGESGCGKSVTALSIIRLLPQPMGQVLGGRIIFEGRDLLQTSEEDIHAIRGARIGMIFQEPMTALNPVHRIGKQLSEGIPAASGCHATDGAREVRGHPRQGRHPLTGDTRRRVSASTLRRHATTGHDRDGAGL
jgi:ABC-type dipeptide/oligopeptide/nickel transport system ATPase component